MQHRIQKFGGFLAGMVIPNIGAFIAWGLITALFIDSGWLPNEQLETMVSPMITYLLPILIAFTGGKMIYDHRGGVAGTVVAMGAIVGSDIPMFLAAMVLGPLGAYAIKKLDGFLHGKVKSGFEMLVNNFSIGILGMLLAVFSFYIIGPSISGATTVVTSGINFIMDANLLPLLAVLIEPAKVVFLNNAIDQGIFVPLGTQEVVENGKTMLWMLVSSPAPGAGVLLAYSLFGKGNSQKAAPSALLIQFVGGIHEVYFPYVLMKPIMFLSVITGGVTQIIVWSMLNAGLAGYPHPGSIVSFLIMLPRGGFFPVILGVLAGVLGSFLVSAFVLKLSKEKEEVDENTSLSDDIGSMLGVTSTGKKVYTKDIDRVVFACDAGVGSSAMGAGILRNKFEKEKLDIKVENYSVDNVPKDVKIILTHKNLKERAKKAVPNAKIRTVESFLNDPEYDRLLEDLKKGEVS